jgi:hypothetical protein
MHRSSFRRSAVLAMSLVTLAFGAVTPAAFAGGDDGDEPEETLPAAPVEQSSSSESSSSSSSSGSSGDTQIARGGVQTGFGGMATDPSMTIPLALAGGAMILLTTAGAGGMALRRR